MLSRVLGANDRYRLADTLRMPLQGLGHGQWATMSDISPSMYAMHFGA